MLIFITILLQLLPRYNVNRKEVIQVAENKTFKVGRDSKSGEFIPVKVAERRPNTTTVERVPKPGYGDTKPSPKK